MSAWISIPDMIRKVMKERLPEDTPSPAPVRLQFMPRNRNSNTAMTFTERFQVQYKIQVLFSQLYEYGVSINFMNMVRVKHNFCFFIIKAAGYIIHRLQQTNNVWPESYPFIHSINVARDRLSLKDSYTDIPRPKSIPWTTAHPK